jgi:hypothetical protein
MIASKALLNVRLAPWRETEIHSLTTVIDANYLRVNTDPMGTPGMTRDCVIAWRPGRTQ